MKKVFAVMALAVSFAACNNADNSAEEAKKAADDSIKRADSMAKAAKMEADKMMQQDTTHKMGDTSKMKMEPKMEPKMEKK